MKLIVAVDQNWGIGKNGNLLFYLPDDLKYFKEQTKGKKVVMGRKTLESLPQGKPLPNRHNIVISSSKQIQSNDNLVVMSSLEEFLSTIDVDKSDDIYVIGGCSIYNALMNKCNELLITKIYEDGKADILINNVDNIEDFECVYESELQEYKGIQYRFTQYRKKI